jgi:hypothetical protein
MKQPPGGFTDTDRATLGRIESKVDTINTKLDSNFSAINDQLDIIEHDVRANNGLLQDILIIVKENQRLLEELMLFNEAKSSTLKITPD